MSNRQNIFITLLELLKVKHTKEFSNQYFNEHPHKYNMYGLSKMLSEYRVENVAIRIDDKERNLKEIQTPFIAQFGKDFAAVYKVDSKNISFVWQSLSHELPVTKFIEAWSGVTLLAETSQNSIEPDYKEHRKTTLLQFFIKALLFCAGGFILLATYLWSALYTSIGLSLLLLINLAGVFISWLLMLRHLHIQSRYADKICSLFKQSNCNSVLESSAAKLFGIIGWSEVGLGYFITNVILLLFAPALITYVALINLVTLPFAFWSVWYQYSKAKQWCPLCLTVQVLLWLIFAVNCIWGYIQMPQLGFEALLTLTMVGCGYAAAILGLTVLLPHVNTENTVQELRQSINSIKADEDVFATLLKKQSFYETNDCHSVIHFGDSNAPLQLSVLSNPYCNPCSKMHKRLEELLKKTGNHIGIQYILSSFRKELNTTNKYLIAACLAKDQSALQIFSDWFEKGKVLKDEYFKDQGLNMDNPEIEAEFARHESWKKKSQIRGTPTILVNGYQLPENYKIEDLQNFTDFNVNIKKPCHVAGKEQSPDQ